MRAPAAPHHASSEDAAALQALLALVDKELLVLRPARERLYDFMRVMKPEMDLNWFNLELCDALQQFFEDAMAGKQPRLMIFAPPRHGKSEAASRCFPAWGLGKNPKLNIIACSYAAMLASQMNRDVQRLMDQELYQEIFPESRLNSENVATVSGKPLRNSDVFEIVHHLGRYRSAGVGGGITGQGFDIGLIDDPLADAAAALSQVVRDGIWEWYRTTFRSRKSPLSGIILIMTRWHEDDLAGRLLQQQREGGDQWKVIIFPAIAEEDEKHRKIGEALHPRRYPLDDLLATKQVSGSYNWSALYQQRPTPEGGSIFDRNHWKYYKALPTLEEVILSVDCTFKELVDNDFVAIQAWGRKGADKYLLRRVKQRLGFKATCDAIRSMKALYPMATTILVEDKANGSAVIETLSKDIAGVVAITPEGGKVARAFAIQGEQEAGNIWLPDATIDNDIETFMAEVTSFPNVLHDDETDAMTQAVNWMRNREGAYNMLEYMRRQTEALKAQKAA